jgi:hypothetical protein
MTREGKLAFILMLAVAPTLSAQEPAKKAARTTYVVQAKVTRAFIAPDGNLERTNVTLPEITTLEGTRGEYVTEKKIQAGLYQTRLQVSIHHVSEAKVQIDVLAEEIWSEGPMDAPVVHRKGLQISRRVGLGEKLKFAMAEKNEKEEGVWFELTVKEAEE